MFPRLNCFFKKLPKGFKSQILLDTSISTIKSKYPSLYFQHCQKLHLKVELWSLTQNGDISFNFQNFLE